MNVANKTACEETENVCRVYIGSFLIKLLETTATLK